MKTKLLFAALLGFLCITTCYAQNEMYKLKSKPFPFLYKDYKANPVYPKIFKLLPFVDWKKNKSDTTNLNSQSALGDILIDSEDGMPILKPYPQSTYHERGSVLNPYTPLPFGNRSYVYPMPNPLNKALIGK